MSGDETSPSDDPTEGNSKLSPRADFDRALSATASLVESGVLQWRLSGGARINPRLDEEAVVRAVGPKDTKDRQKFERILSQEIVPSLNRAARSIGAFAFEAPQDLSPTDRHEQAARSKAVKERLYSDALQQRVLIRRTCKGSVLEGVRWDISIKKHDLGTGSVPDLPYGTIEMAFAASAEEGPLSFFGVSSQRQVVSFDCHLHDLDGLLADLMDLKSNLEKLSAERTGK